MEDLRIPTRKVEVRILLDDGEAIDAAFFTATTSPGGRPETVLDRLNDSSRDFVPVVTRGAAVLLNKAGMVTVQVPGHGEIAELRSESAHDVRARLSIAGGVVLQGRLLLVMPPERSRVIDYLNDAARFFPLVGDECVTLVQTRSVISVETEEER